MKHIKTKTMKTLITLFLFATSFLTIKSQELTPIYKADTCKKFKTKHHYILGKGYILHCECKTEARRRLNFFFHTYSVGDSAGILLNKNFPLNDYKMRMKTYGVTYFRVKVVGGFWIYQYTFDTESWTKKERTISPSTR